MVQGGMACIKYLLFAFNFIFVVSGIGLIATGAYAQSSGKEYTLFLESKFFTAPVILIIVGCIVFLIAFLGCCGAIKENYCMVVTFGALLFLIFIIEIAGGITAYVYKSEVENFLKKNMLDSLEQEKDDAKKVWDEIQQKFHCCGANNASDYKGQKIPSSCCGNIPDAPCDEAKAYKKGCFEDLKVRLEHAIAVVGGVGIGIAFIELLGVVFACCLASAIKKEYEGV